MKKKTITSILAATLTLAMAFGLCACGTSADATADTDTEEAVIAEETEIAEPVEDTEEVAEAVEEDTEDDLAPWEKEGYDAWTDYSPYIVDDYAPVAEMFPEDDPSYDVYREIISEGYGTEENPIWEQGFADEDDNYDAGWYPVGENDTTYGFLYKKFTMDLDTLIEVAENGECIKYYYMSSPGLTLDALYEARDNGWDLNDNTYDIIDLYCEE